MLPFNCLVFRIYENAREDYARTVMDIETVDPLLTAKIVGSYVRHHSSAGSASRPHHLSAPALNELGQQILRKRCSSLLCRCGNLCVTTSWFV